ncbi:zinc finger CCCH domain-containing protein 13-like isoform X3 [Oncorhynchus keta]|uniref:zinc finger CCCH domain-containing protein 13-like isoform X3 n=1 Tax=Oncorhynchus keta TaxID=8018 RepID=UPI00227BB47E|nr:zinc finger CCCH domain-containing protein 13-like isoform X3 [Oncorhynchus keta]
MAAKVEVQTGEVERICVGGRLHLSPLSDSSNKSLTEGPSNTQASLIITPEPSKPVPTPKPRLTPKPFTVEKNPTIRPILAPKPNTNPRPVPTRPTSYKPDSPSTPKLQQPNVTSKHRPGPTNPSCPAPNSYKPSHKLSMGQTTKPVAQPFKPAPLLTLGDPSKPTPSQPVRRQKPAAAGLFPSRGPKKPPSAEWSGSTKPEKERNKTASSIRAGAASMTRAKSMGFLSQIGQDEEERKGDERPTVTVQLRSQSRASRPRPVSAIFLPSPTQAESPTPAARWAVRRPLSADLTSKFESIGLSLHHGRPAKTDSKENTPGEPLRRTEKKKGAEGTNVTPAAPDSKPSALVGGREKKTEEEEEEEDDEGKGGGSIKRRISLLLDSSTSSSPVVPLRVAAQRPGSNSPVQPIQEADVTLDGVKQRTRKLTEDTVTPPAQTPAVKPQFKSHPLPPDLTKRLGSERSTDLGSPSPNEATDRHESDTDPQMRVEDSVYTFSDPKKVDDDIRGIQEQPTQTTSDPSAVLTEAGRWMESCPSSGAQTVRAALFENVVERHSVLVMEEDRAQSATKGCPKRSVSLKLGNGENDGTLVTATYRKPVSPSSPLLVEHLFDTVQAVGERRAVSESVPLAQLEDKAMTLRSRRSEGNRSASAEPVEERHAQVQGVLSLAQRRAPASQQEQGPYYLRVGALQKWNTTEMDREAEVEKERQREAERERKEEEKERQREAERERKEEEKEKQREAERERKEEEKERQREAERRMQMDVDREKPREQEREREEVAAPKRLKMLEADEQPPKPRATYFALTGQIQEAVSVGDEETERGNVEVPFDNFSMKSGHWGSQGKVLQVRRNPSLDEAFGKSSQGQQQEELMERNQTQERERGTAWDRQTWSEELGIEQQVDLEKVKELEREKEWQRESKEFEREKWTQLDMERQKPLEYARKREKEKLKELERERHNELENERLSERQRQRWHELQRERQIELERQKEFEKERQRQLDLERQKEFEKERQRQLDLERQKEFEKERQRQLDLERQKEFEKERQRQLDLERQKEFEKERQRQLDLERQKEFENERQRQLDLERQKEFEKERQRQLDLERQKKLERIKEMERKQMFEFEKQKQNERERQQLLELETQRLREKMEREEQEKMRQQAIQQEEDRQRELERERVQELERERQRDLERQKQRELERERQRDLERQKQRELERERQRDLERQKQRELERERQRDLERQQRELERERQRDLERQKQRELERQRQKQLDFERQELENQRDRKRELETERQRVEELERIKEMERRQLFEFEKQKQNERERQLLHELGKQRLRENMEREEQEKMRQVAIQEEAERQRTMERQRRENQERGVLDSLPLRPKMLDLDSGCWSLGDLHSRGSPHSPSVRWKQPSPWADDHYRPGILDIDSFRSQTETQPSPTREVFPVTGIQGSDPGNGVRSHPHSPEREGGYRMAPEGAVGRPSTVWTPSQQELWEQRLSIDEESVDRPMAGPEPPRKPANKPSLEQLLHGLEDRATAPILVPERRWSGMPSEPSFPRREPHSPGSPMEQTWFPQDSEPQGHRVEARGQRRSQGSQELNRMRSRSVSRRSAPSDSAVEGSLSRMRSRSTHRERGGQSWEQLKQNVDGEEGRDMDTLVHETDSQYGTWETGLHTDDSLTPATPTSDSQPSQSPRKPTPLYTPGEHVHTPPSDLDTPDGFSAQPEIQPLPFPEASTSLLDSSALRSRVQLSKMRGPRSRPSRVSRQTAALSVHPEGQATPTEDWRSRDSTEDKVESSKKDSDSEEQTRGADPHSAAASSQPQRVALFPGMDPSALMAQLKKRSDSDIQTEGPSTSPSQSSRSPKSPFLPRASRVLPPSGGKEDGEEASPQWLRELKSKKRLSCLN